MVRSKHFIYAALGTLGIYLFSAKLRRVKTEYQSYFSQLNLKLKERYSGASAAIVDLDRLDANVRFIRNKLGNEYKLRLVTKSLPSLDLLKYLLETTQTNRLMVFSEPFIVEILTNMEFASLDILLGKPLSVDAFSRLTTYRGWTSIHWLIDTKDRLNQYLFYAQRENLRIKISLEIDIGLHRGGFETIEDFTEVVKIIQQNSRYLELTGLMGYDGHVPYVPFYINKQKAIQKAFIKTLNRYRRFVDELKKHYGAEAIRNMTFNSGGSHTYFNYSDVKSSTAINDIAIGSGFVTPQQFSNLIKLGHQPSLFLSSPVLKKLESSKLPHAEKFATLLNLWNPNLSVSYFTLGGGWPGELISPVGMRRNHWWDENDLGYSNLLPNQSIVSSSDKNNIRVDDFVFYHPWQGDGMLCFRKLVLYRQAGFVGEWSTFNGGN
ncbi:unnamed protein product [Adineta ricciae]|uniref:Alanine racemase N-terminal domain-containing protein n=1 Tax=Adineta ricciae TaxID=249248 RepID=A0A815EGX9_ADIRI|nr:unnamed protein product [Adineta ricciae]CAF1535280.1 unnamed protein product [Adineta ricciae]